MEEQNSSKKKRGKRFFILLLIILAVGAAAKIYNQAKILSNVEIPESLLELKERYPETAEFVNSYPIESGRVQNRDLSQEVQQGTIPLFLQWDKRWGYETYGSDFLAITGCGPTCISMVVCGLTGDTSWNPYAVAKFSEEQGYYVPGEGTSWELMTTGAQQLGVYGENVWLSADSLVEKLSMGCPVICSMYPGDFTTSGHFIVLTGVDDEGQILVNDPNSKINSEKHWSADTILSQTRSMWVYYA